MRTIPTLGLLALVIALSGGCRARVTETYPGYPADQVWRAAKAVAETPDYRSGDVRERWVVAENHAWADDEEGRIEIYRRLERERHAPGQVVREDQTWTIRVTMEATDPPTLRFMNRKRAVRADVWTEALRYFRDVEAVLRGELVEPPATAPASATSG